MLPDASSEEIVLRFCGTLLGLACGLCALVPSPLQAQGPSASTRNWAWDQAKSWTCYRTDARGQRIWNALKFMQLSPAEQTDQLLEHLKSSATDRRAALIVLGDRPLDQWAAKALARSGAHPEVAQFLFRRGYRQPGNDPLAYLGDGSRLGRPWTQGLGLHLEGERWRFQWIPSPALLPKIEGGSALPKALDSAPQPGVLLHLRAFRPGLLRLQKLAGGEAGVVPTLAQGTRAGFLVRHLEPWLRQAAPVLEPLANRETWVLHYGLSRGSGPEAGTLLFLPGDLPTRTQLALSLLKLNPTSQGARSRGVTWAGPGGVKADITQIRGAGGVLHLWTTSEGTWIGDRESTLKALIFPGAAIPLGERPEWTRVALAALKPETEVSLWLAPRLSADAAFECQASRRRAQGLQQQTWPNPFIAKAAPRGGSLAISLGAGPTEQLVNGLLRVDAAADLAEPSLGAFTEGGRNLSPEQQKAYQSQLLEVRRRNQGKRALREEIKALQATLDLRGAALHWNGWTPAPALNEAQKKALKEFGALQKEGPWEASRLQRNGELSYFGGFGEPGMTPALALALPLQEGKQAVAEGLIKKLWPKLFQGETQRRTLGGVVLHRTRTEQAFTPCYALVKDHLLLGSDERALENIAAGLQGQTPTLADMPSGSYGAGEFEGARVAQDLEGLLLAYLRANKGGGVWWLGEPSPTEDEAAQEVAATLGPFLGALRALGRRTVDLDFTAAGLEIRPR